MRILSYIIGVIFTLFAIVQFNDPDSALWVLAYLLPAVIAFVYPHKKPGKLILLILALAYLVGAVILFPPSLSSWLSAEEQSKSLGMTLPGIEEARESMGLFLCFLALGFYWVKSR